MDTLCWSPMALLYAVAVSLIKTWLVLADPTVAQICTGLAVLLLHKVPGLVKTQYALECAMSSCNSWPCPLHLLWYGLAPQGKPGVADSGICPSCPSNGRADGGIWWDCMERKTMLWESSWMTWPGYIDCHPAACPTSPFWKQSDWWCLINSWDGR